MRVENLEKYTAVATGSQDALEYQSLSGSDNPEYLMGVELLGYNETTSEGLCVVMNCYIYCPGAWGISLQRHYSSDSGVQFIPPKPIALHSPLRVRGIFNSVINGYHLRMNVLLGSKQEVFGP